MQLSIKQSIYRAILENKWLNVEYVNSKKERTSFFCGIKEINIDNGRIDCDIFNCFKPHPLMRGERNFIYLEGIQSARIIEQSFYMADSSLLKRVREDKNLFQFLEADVLQNNVLAYLSDCYRFDNDPYLDESIRLDHVDIKELKEKRRVILVQEEFDALINGLFKKTVTEAENQYRFVDLAINSFSIDIKDKQYVVAYYRLNLNFKDRCLMVEDTPIINQSFLIDGKAVSLSSYLDMSPATFCTEYRDKKRELINQIEVNYNRGELTNTRPNIFLIRRNSTSAVDKTFEAIAHMEEEGTLPQPLKSFFGRSRPRSGTKKAQSIVVFDKTKVNIDQMRVIYNAMVNHVTYVQGPPGTGKTETIFNVILSAYANNKTTLICSNNNHPIDDICTRLYASLFKASETRSIRMPFLRLGNMEEMAKAILALRKDCEIAESYKKISLSEASTAKSKEGATSFFNEFRDLLAKFEERINITERIETLDKLAPIAKNATIIEEISKQKVTLETKLKEIPYIHNEDIRNLIVSASEDKDFQNFMFYSSLSHFKKLLSFKSARLREIISISDVQEAANALVRYLKEDDALAQLQEIYPIICCTNQSSDRLGTPKPHFDLAIMDEAGQCNEATSLIPMARANSLLLVGDVNQLQPVTVIEPDFHAKLKKQYGISDEYDYMSNSILSCMQRKDANSKSIMLRYHYRCGKAIAGFSNQRFYHDQLKLEKQAKGELLYCNVANTRFDKDRNSYKEEARAIVDLIQKNGYKDVGIITPFVNQAHLINQELKEAGIHDVSAGTIHSLQGSEKNTIIFSAALSLRTATKTMDWVKDNHELINVGVTRAKERLVFVGDKDAIDALSKGETNDIKALSDYIHTNGECFVPAIEDRSFSNYSNDSASEKEFFETITPYFNRRKNKMRVQRNVPLQKAIPNFSAVDAERAGKKEFDVIVQVAEGLLKKNYRTIIAFEIDGGEHIGNRVSARQDRVKEEICRLYGIKLIRIANNQVKDYELIIALFECVLKEVPDIDTAFVQGSLFGEDEITTGV